MSNITYTWGIASLERNLPGGEVYTAHWTLNATRGAESPEGNIVNASAYGSVGLPEANPEDPDFVPYESLTLEAVIEWVKEALGGEEKAAEMKEALVAQIEEQLEPKKASGTPWQ
jgi:hypothetical protein